MKIVKLLSYLILIVFTFVNSWNMLHAKLVRHDDPRVRPLTDTILTHLAQEGKKKPLLLIADYHKWGIASGVMLQLRKANQGFAIQGWHPILQHEPTGNEDEYLWFTGRYFHEQLKHDPRYKQIAREENCFVYEAPLSLMKDSQTVWKMIEEEDRQTSGFRTKQKEGT